jgi:hypothetical protein
MARGYGHARLILCLAVQWDMIHVEQLQEFTLALPQEVCGIGAGEEGLEDFGLHLELLRRLVIGAGVT